jgi:ABC-type branched-subunit amino acid transport system substrate-binding protein
MTPDGDAREVEGLTSCDVVEPGHYYIAALTTFTGPAILGESHERALLQALDDINANGGVDGRSVGLITCDSACDASTAQAAANEVLGATPPVSGILGPLCSGATVPVVENVLTTNGIPTISPSASTPSLTDVEDDGWFFRTLPSDALQGVIINAIAQREGLQKVFVINRDDAYGNGLREVFLGEFDAAGGTSDFIAFDDESPDFAATAIQAAQAFEPEAVFIVGFPNDAAAIMQTAINESFDPAMGWLGPDGLRNDDFIANVGNDAYLEGMRGTIPASPTGPQFQTFADRYRELYGEDPGAFAVNIYDGAYLLAMAMELAEDPENRAQVQSELASSLDEGTDIGPESWAELQTAVEDASTVDYVGASGPVDFDENGDVVSNLEEWRITNGAFETVNCWTPEAELCN